MIPYLLIASGAYLLGQTRDVFAKGGILSLKEKALFAGLISSIPKLKYRKSYKKIAKGRELFITELLRQEDGLYTPVELTFEIKDGKKEIANASMMRLSVRDAIDIQNAKKQRSTTDRRKLGYVNRKHLGLDDYTWEISSIQVHGEYRGEGLATRLFSEIKDWAKKNGVHNLFLYRKPFEPGFGRSFFEAGLNDRQLKKFYNNQGFIEIGDSVMATQLSNGGKLPTRLEDICEIRTDFPDADFWLQRRGSEKTIGTPKRFLSVSHDINKENIGIKVKPEYTDFVSPEFLYYSLQQLHQQGIFENMAVGSLALKNLRVSEVKKIPLRFGINK